MPSESAHVAQAEKNERFYNAITSQDAFNDYPDWAVVALFYSALHYVDSYLGHLLRTADPDRAHPKGHRARHTVVSQLPQLAPVAPNYLELYNRSIDARYELISFSPAQVQHLARAHFEPIKRLVRDLLGLP